MRRALLALSLVGVLGCPAPEPSTVPPAPAAETPAAPATPAPRPSATPKPAAVAEAWTPPTIERLPDPAAIPDSPSGLDNGAFAPRLDLTDLRDGSAYSLDAHVGPLATAPTKVAVVGFAASWCGRCKLSYPYLAKLKQEMGDDLEVVFVTTDETEPLMKKEKDLVLAAGLDVPVLKPDEHTLQAWLGRKRNIPHFYIINKAGEVLVQDRGFGNKVEKVMPGQIRYALNHPEYVDRRPRPKPTPTPSAG